MSKNDEEEGAFFFLEQALFLSLPLLVNSDIYS